MSYRLVRYIANIASLDWWFMTYGNNRIWWSMNFQYISKTSVLIVKHPWRWSNLKNEKPWKTTRNHKPKIVKKKHNIKTHRQWWLNPNIRNSSDSNVSHVQKTSVSHRFTKKKTIAISWPHKFDHRSSLVCPIMQ